MLAAQLRDRHTAFALAQNCKNLGVAISRHLHQILLRYLAEKILFLSAANFRGSATQTPGNFKTASPATALVKASVLGYSVPKLEISCNETSEIFDYCMLYFRNQRLVANPLFFIPE